MTRTPLEPDRPDCERLTTAIRDALEVLAEIDLLRLDAQASGHAEAESILERDSRDIVEAVQAGVKTLLIHLVSHGH